MTTGLAVLLLGLSAYAECDSDGSVEPLQVVDALIDFSLVLHTFPLVSNEHSNAFLTALSLTESSSVDTFASKARASKNLRSMRFN